VGAREKDAFEHQQQHSNNIRTTVTEDNYYDTAQKNQKHIAKTITNGTRK
jgi:hypothetical protein